MSKMATHTTHRSTQKLKKIQPLCLFCPRTDIVGLSKFQWLSPIFPRTPGTDYVEFFLDIKQECTLTLPKTGFNPESSTKHISIDPFSLPMPKMPTHTTHRSTQKLKKS